MKHYQKSLLMLLVLPVLALPQVLKAQREPIRLHHNFPLIATATFQNFSLPFHDFPSHFTHPGLLIGTEVALNHRRTLLQQAHLGGYLNGQMGHGVVLMTQFVYRPRIWKNLSGELKAGVGIARTGHPAKAFVYEDGQWQSASDGKTQVMIPLGFSLEYHRDPAGSAWVPFIGYQVVPMLGYNDVLPLSFTNHFQLGLRVYLNTQTADAQ